MKKLLAALFLFAFLFSCQKENKKEQERISKNQLQLQKWYNDINKMSRMLPDSLKVFAQKMEVAAINEPKEYKAMAALISGVNYNNETLYELAFKQYEKALRLLEKSKADTIKARIYNAIGSYYKNKGDFPNAAKNFYLSISIYEKHNKIAGIADVRRNIAEVQMQKGDFKPAKENLETALRLLKKDKSNQVYLSSAHMLANLYGMNGDYANALTIDEEGIRITDSINSPNIKVSFLDNKANCFMYSNRLDSAQYYFDQCLKIDMRYGNKKQIADSYSNLAQLASFKKDFPTAEKQILNSIAILKEINNRINLSKSYSILSQIYERQKNYEKAFHAQKKFHNEYKLMIDEKKEASLAEFKIVYETQKKEQQLAENKVLLLQNEAESKQKNTTIIILAILALFIAIVGYLFYRQQKLKTRQREHEFQLKTAISQIETQNKLQEQRLNISRDLHDNIGAQLTFIISSVDNVKYGFDLQNNRLSNKLDSISDFTKSTIIELRDTIWAMNNNQITFEDLRARIFNFIQKAKIATENIKFKFNIDSNLNEIRLTSVQGINIYRTIQEAVNNTIKYAEATEICINAKIIEKQIEIEIKDNGKGFDIETTEKGNGMINMQKRIDDIGGIFKVISEEKKGTRIIILLFDIGKTLNVVI